jgi:hypothetical protein
MTSFFPDLNVWLALSDAGHSHSTDAWDWFKTLSSDATLIFCRYTQIGLLRVLTNQSVMGEQTLTLRKAWSIYDQWLEDPRVAFHPEPRRLDETFRQITEPLAAKPASKWIGDCYLLAYANDNQAVLVTFDAGLHALARKQGYAVVTPA